MVVITNVGAKREPLGFVLLHEEFCKNAGQCACRMTTTFMVSRDRKTGEKYVTPMERRLPSSESLLPGETKTLPDAILKVRKVKEAISNQQILARPLVALVPPPPPKDGPKRASETGSKKQAKGKGEQ